MATAGRKRTLDPQLFHIARLTAFHLVFQEITAPLNGLFTNGQQYYEEDEDILSSVTDKTHCSTDHH
jgi:hypothetical protein